MAASPPQTPSEAAKTQTLTTKSGAALRSPLSHSAPWHAQPACRPLASPPCVCWGLRGAAPIPHSARLAPGYANLSREHVDALDDVGSHKPS